MTIKELKDWVNNLPEELLNYSVVNRTLTTTEEEGKFGQKDDPIVSAMVDKNASRLCLFNIESQQVVQIIREMSKSVDEKIKGSDVVDSDAPAEEEQA